MVIGNSVVFNGNVAVYKDLNLVTVSIKIIIFNVIIRAYIALASIRSFAVVLAVLTYVYWFSVLAGSVSTDQQEKEERRQTGPRAGRIMTQRLPTRFDYQ